MNVQNIVLKYEWGQGFTFEMINFSVSYVLINVEQEATSRRALQVSREILDREGACQYWMATVATHWRNFLEGSSLYSCSPITQSQRVLITLDAVP